MEQLKDSQELTRKDIEDAFAGFKQKYQDDTEGWIGWIGWIGSRGVDGRPPATGGCVRRWVQTWGSGAEPRGKFWPSESISKHKLHVVG